MGGAGGSELPLAVSVPRPPESSKPLLLVVHGEPALARELEHDLRSRFGPGGFEPRCVDSVEGAFALIAAIRERGGQLALVIADQDIGLSGSAVVSTAREVHPQAKTVLLVQHEQMEAALERLNEGVLDYFLVKPLGARERQLLPIVEDLLDDWQRRADAAARAVTVIGGPDSAATLELHEFLCRNDVHCRHLDPDRDEEAREAVGEGGRAERVPMVVLEDGSTLNGPSARQLGDAIGLQTRPRSPSCDLAIVGGGPAGMAAAVYGASEGLATTVVERFAPGGQAGQSSRIENYLGFPGGVSGSLLAQRALRQALAFKAEIVRPCEVSGLVVEGSTPVLRLGGHTELRCRTALIACGVAYRRLQVEGIEDLIGRGVYYGAGASDALELEGSRVAVVGGANSAGQAALHFAEHAGTVTMLVRSDSLGKRMSEYLAERIVAHAAIEVRTGTEVVGVTGHGRLQGIRLSTGDGDAELLEADALFIFIGAVPKTSWLPQSVRRDDRGFVLSGRDLFEAGRPAGWPLDRDPYPLETSVPGVFVAGDVRHGSIKRVASAVGEGGMAIQLIHEFLTEHSGRRPPAADHR